MYIELSLILFVAGLYALITGDEIKKIIGLSLSLSASNIPIVLSGALILIPLTVVIDVALIITYIVLNNLGE